MELLIFLVIGIAAGWLAGQVMKGGGFGLIGDLVLGVLRAFVGGSVLGFAGIDAGGLIGRIVVATFGAVLMVALTRLLRKAA